MLSPFWYRWNQAIGISYFILAFRAGTRDDKPVMLAMTALAAFFFYQALRVADQLKPPRRRRRYR